MCHHNSFLIYDSLIEQTEKKWGQVTHISVVASMICTFILGITGYATFTGYSQGKSIYMYQNQNKSFSAFLPLGGKAVCKGARNFYLVKTGVHNFLWERVRGFHISTT